ncbi:MAG: DUF5302 domain-containing protein [Streptosporangiaceae bacterium]|nr:DUF5302 domain-containing protein [Streptosporangiaceae bacterium]
MAVEQPEGETSPGATARPATPGRAAKAGEAADADRAADAGGPAQADLTEVKRKFRQALERKRGTHAAGNAEGAAPGTGKVHGSHGPAAGRRSFRRKSGG